ncbi:MAG: hypothetical protein WA825_07250 [Steroidobacteraceae bacterium]
MNPPKIANGAPASRPIRAAMVGEQRVDAAGRRLERYFLVNGVHVVCESWRRLGPNTPGSYHGKDAEARDDLPA